MFQKNLDVLFISVFCPALFPQHIPIHLYKVAYKWRIDKIIYQQVKH